MKSWTILALLFTVCAVFLGVGHTEETPDDFREVALEDANNDAENDAQLADSFKNPENDDDDDDDNDDDDDDDESRENAVDGVNETPSNDEDEPEMFKRAPWRRRRRRRRRRRIWRLRRIRLPRIRIRLRRVVRRVKDKLKKFKPCLKTVCGFVKNSRSLIVKWACRQVDKLRDEEEYPLLSSDEMFIEAHEADELVKQGYVKEEQRKNESP
ncbi:Hypothetical predicted protein [Paramuricea clavata]|uniref:Uncharacterized protein n=1 Tax=Paramuricea clavata TaxID=317549 RepID=A0A7D9KY20_PARCT|nr:Hypothetical predicted protein [Paramuricea clavata]